MSIGQQRTAIRKTKASLTPQQRTTLGGLARQHGIRLDQMVFIALRKLSYSQAASYKFTHPNAQDSTCKSSGNVWEKKLKAKGLWDSIDIEDAMLALAETTQVRAMVGDDIEHALRGSDQFNKTRKRYGDAEEAKVNILAVLGGLAGGEAPSAGEVDLEPPLILDAPGGAG